MPLGSDIKTDLVFKKIKGRRITTTDKAFYEEFPGFLSYLHKTELWTDDIPVPAPSATNSVVEVINDLQLTEDLSTSDHKAWLACSTVGDTSTQLKGFIPPKFDQSYTVRIFQDDGSGGMGDEIPTAHPSNWFFDYENGVLVFENDPQTSGLTTPIHLKAYQYIGETGEDGLGGDNWRIIDVDQDTYIQTSDAADSDEDIIDTVVMGNLRKKLTPDLSSDFTPRWIWDPYQHHPTPSWMESVEARYYGLVSYRRDDGVASGFHYITTFYRTEPGPDNAGFSIMYHADGSKPTRTILYAPGYADFAITTYNNNDGVYDYPSLFLWNNAIDVSKSPKIGINTINPDTCLTVYARGKGEPLASFYNDGENNVAYMSGTGLGLGTNRSNPSDVDVALQVGGSIVLEPLYVNSSTSLGNLTRALVVVDSPIENIMLYLVDAATYPGQQWVIQVNDLNSYTCTLHAASGTIYPGNEDYDISMENTTFKVFSDGTYWRVIEL